jgi:hypothetical protein
MFPLHNNLTFIVLAYGIEISQYNSTGSWFYSQGHVYLKKSDVRPTGTTHAPYQEHDRKYTF